MGNKIERFWLKNKIHLSLPNSYRRNKILDSFLKRIQREFPNYKSCVFDRENYNGSNILLKANHNFIVKMFVPGGPPIHSDAVKTEEWVELFQKQKAIWTGVHGLLALWRYKKDELPKGYNYLSMSGRGSFPLLSKSDDLMKSYFVPYLRRTEKGPWVIRDKEYGFDKWIMLPGGKTIYLCFTSPTQE